jgi:hypothetical protein
MKTKTSSKKVPTPFFRRIALLGCGLLALTIFAPAFVEAVTINLDNPNQTVAAPPSGTTIVDFAGTITLNPNYFVSLGSFQPPFNQSGSNSLTSTITDEFFLFLSSPPQPFTQTFTGTILELSVFAGTPPGLYAFDRFGGPSEIFLMATLPGGLDPLSAREPFSVLVTGVDVPDRGSSILLLGLSLAALCSVQRAFVSRAKRVAA